MPCGAEAWLYQDDFERYTFGDAMNYRAMK